MTLYRISLWSVFVFFSFLLTSCATAYRSLDPETLFFDSANVTKDVRIEYATDFLPGRYGTNERKTDVHVIAVKLTNNSSKAIILKNNLKVFRGSHEVSLVDLNSVYHITQQNPDKFLKYMFLLPLNVYSKEQETYGGRVTSSKTRFFPVGIVLGPALAFGNKGVASKANKRYKADLEQNDIMEKIIPAGKTEWGFLGLKENPAAPLQFEIIN